MLIYLAMQDTSCERDRLAEIYQKYKNQMFALANSILGDVRDSEDVVHEAFVAMIPYIDRLPEEAAHPKVRAFALTLAESKVLDLYRKRKRQKLVFWDDAFDENTAVPFYDPVTEGSDIAKAIANLSPSDSRLLMWRFDVGLTTKEIAKILGKKEGTVTRAITRAKERLAKELEKEGVSIK